MKIWKVILATLVIFGAGVVNGAKSFFTQAFPEYWLYVLGLAFMGALQRLPFLSRELKFHHRPGTGLAGAPLLVENLSPCHSAGLWLAVMLIPPMALRRRIV